jgi:hypothetical protein
VTGKDGDGVRRKDGRR